MPVHKNVPNCTHIKVTGVRCGSPALRGKVLCYFHQRMTNFVPITDSRIHHAAMLESEESIQAAIMELVNGLIRGTMELKRGEVILRALNTAVRNSRRVRFGADVDKMVHDLPSHETLEAQIADTRAHEKAAEAEASQATAQAAAQRRAVDAMIAEARARATAKASATSASATSGNTEVRIPAEAKEKRDAQSEANAKGLTPKAQRPTPGLGGNGAANAVGPTPEVRRPTPALRKPPQSARAARTPSSARAKSAKAS